MSGRSRSSILGGALVFSSKERGMLVCVCVCESGGLYNILKNVGITWSVAHMFLLPVWKYSKLPEMISSLNLRKFHPWCQNPYPTHTEGL